MEISAELRQQLSRVRLIVFDFDGVFTDNHVYVFEDGREAVRCTRADGLGLQKLAQVGVEACILSTEVNPVVSARATKLKIECRQGCPDKGLAITDMIAERGLSPDQVAYVGNDINDSDPLRLVGVPILVADAHPDVKQLAKIVTSRPGGHGAVREVCDLLADAREGVAI